MLRNPQKSDDSRPDDRQADEPHCQEPPTAERFALRLALFYGMLFTTLGVQLPFLPVWLVASGLDSRAIGFVLALPMIVRVFAIPIATRVADRRDSLRSVMIVASCIALVGYAALAMAAGPTSIALAFTVASAGYTPITLLVDAYAIRGLARRGRAYGPVRLWGSAAFIVASFGAGLLLDLMAPRDLIWLIVGAMGLTVAAVVMLVPLQPEAGTARPAPARAANTLLRIPGFVAVLAAASLIQASHAVYYGFATIDWRAAGFDGTAIGSLWALGVLAEIVLFAVSARLPATIPSAALILAGAAGACLRWTAMALGPPALLLPALQALHAFSFGATHLGALSFVARTAPAGLATTAQGFLGVALGLTMAGAMALCGLLYERDASLAYGAMAVLAAAGGLCGIAAYWQVGYIDASSRPRR